MSDENTETESRRETAESRGCRGEGQAGAQAAGRQAEGRTADAVEAPHEDPAADEAAEADATRSPRRPSPRTSRSRRASRGPQRPRLATRPAAQAPKAEKADAPTAKAPSAASRKPVVRSRRGRHEAQEPVAAPVVRAQAKYVRSSARKARLVCDNIRGKSVADARAILAHTPRAVARDWSKLLESAIANAENNHDLDGEDLVIKAVHADEGPTIKRFRPRAMGRATKIRKRTAHLTILLTPKN